MVQIINFEKTSDYQFKVNNLDDASLDIPCHQIEGVSYENDYTPFYSAWVNKGIYENKVIHYSIPKEEGVTSSRYNDLFNNLSRGTIPKAFQTKSMSKPIYVMKGLMYELDSFGNPIIHFLLGVKSREMFSLNPSLPVDYSKFAMFLSTSFINGDLFKNVYRRVSKDVILPLQEVNEVDTIITSDIRKWCYKNDFKIPSFKTINGLKDYLKTYNKKQYL